MTRPVHESSRGVRRITLDAAGVPLSALLAEPSDGSARAVVVAVHGGGMNAGYFDCRAHPRQSLLTLGAGLGYTVLAVDRPGYRTPPPGWPRDRTWRSRPSHCARLCATSPPVMPRARACSSSPTPTAARWRSPPPRTPSVCRTCSGWTSPDAATCYAVEPHELPTGRDDSGRLRRSWGPLRLYPPGTFAAIGSVVEPVPALERAELARWPSLFRATAPRVRVPVRLTFAEHEAWWRHDDAALTDLAAHFTAAPRVHVDRQPAAGHNISLGWAARSYHLRALAFLEDCLVSRETILTRPPAVRPLPSVTAS